jgi:hypothetical protein
MNRMSSFTKKAKEANQRPFSGLSKGFTSIDYLRHGVQKCI